MYEQPQTYIPETLSRKITQYAKRLQKTAERISSNARLPYEDALTITQDAEDLLRGTYRGLHATTEQMQRITAAVPAKRWDRTDHVALSFIAQYYAKIADMVQNGQQANNDFLTSVISVEVLRRTNGDQMDEQTAEELRRITETAKYLYYTYCVLITAEWCDATEEELRQIIPPVEVENNRKERGIQIALFSQAQRRRITAADRAKRQAREQRRREQQAASLPLFVDDADSDITQDTTPKTYTIQQNVAKVYGKGVTLADKDNPAAPLIRLWQAIERQRQRANDLITDLHATNEQRQRAQELIATTNGSYSVLDSIQILPQEIKPVSATTEYSEYILTPHQYASIITKRKNPNNEQVLSLLRATAWLSTQRTQVEEQATRRVTYTDKDGRRKSKMQPRTIVTNFTPVTITFQTEYEDGVRIENATKITLHIHNIIVDGRSAAQRKDGKDTLYIQPARRQKLTQLQWQVFTDSEEQRIFKNIILTKPHQAEDTLLAAVFNYDRRQYDANTNAKQAREAAASINADATATAEQRQAANSAADAADKAARGCIYNRIKRDYDQLAGYFEKARACGLVTGYKRTQNNPKTKYGRGYTWSWTRPEDVKKK